MHELSPQQLMTPSARSNFAMLTGSAYISVKAFAVDRLKFGKDYSAIAGSLAESQWLSEGDLKSLQNEKLRVLVRHAFETVPYYRNLFDSLHLRPDDVRTVDDLQKLPLLTKTDLRAQPDAFISRQTNPTFLHSGWTTGSTGMPINVPRDKKSIAFESAMIWRQRGWAGVSSRDRKAAIWGTIWSDVIVPVSYRRPPYWRYNVTDRQLLFSYYHMSERTLPLFLRRLEAFRPSSIEGFPSTLLLVARFMERQRIIIPLKAVFTSSERLFDVHREVIERQFACKVFDLYGQSERVSAATECEAHQGLHVNPEYGITEILKNGEEARPGEMGEIVGTGLNNFAVPLLRYRTGDIAVPAPGKCPCGRAMNLLKYVEGRNADLIETPDGFVVPGNGLMMALHSVENINRSQIVQDAVDHITVRIVPEDPGKPLNVATLVRNLSQCVGEGLHIDVTTAETIEHEGHAKFRWVVSKVHREPKEFSPG